MSDWKIRRKEEACARCEKAFEDGEQHFSVLQVSPEALGREDRCLACHETAEDPEETIFWRTTRREARRGLAVDFESIERLFLALGARTEERLIELRYLLSLLLMRKKRLKLVRVRRSDEAEFMLMRRPRRTEELEVRVFDLTTERTAVLKQELERIFEGAGAEDLTAPVEAEEAEEPEAEPDSEPAADPEASAVESQVGPN
jgi:hypothetical protein